MDSPRSTDRPTSDSGRTARKPPVGAEILAELPNGIPFLGTVADHLSRGRLLLEDSAGNERVVDPDDPQTAIDTNPGGDGT